MTTNTDTTAASGAASPFDHLLAEFQKLKARPDANHFRDYEGLLTVCAQDAALAAPAAQEAEPAVPPGFALVPMRMNREMERVVADEDGWQWEDLLAAACAISESDYTAIMRNELTDDEIRESFTAQGVVVEDAHLEAVREILGNIPRPQADAGAPETPEGCTPADAQILRRANHDLAAESFELQAVLRGIVAQAGGALARFDIAAAPQAPAAPDMESVLIDGVAYQTPAPVAAELLRLHLEAMQAPAAPMSAQPMYQDSTPGLHVGDSSFEDWFQQQPFATQTGVKQIARDAYAAGMGDPLVIQALAPAAGAAVDENEALDLLDALFAAWEDGTPCYDEPESAGSFLGNAFRLDDDTFNRCCELLDRRRSRHTPASTAPAAGAAPTDAEIDDLCREISDYDDPKYFRHMVRAVLARWGAAAPAQEADAKKGGV